MGRKDRKVRKRPNFDFATGVQKHRSFEPSFNNDRAQNFTGADFVIDYASLAQRRGYQNIIEFLTARLGRRNFDRDRVCQRCEGWKPLHGLAAKPPRPFGVPDDSSCSGCAYSYLDRTTPTPKEEKPPWIGGKSRRRVRVLRVIQ